MNWRRCIRERDRTCSRMRGIRRSAAILLAGIPARLGQAATMCRLSRWLRGTKARRSWAMRPSHLKARSMESVISKSAHFLLREEGEIAPWILPRALLTDLGRLLRKPQARRYLWNKWSSEKPLEADMYPHKR
jgi:hypothetical protein